MTHLRRNYCYTLLSLLAVCLAFTACVPVGIELPTSTTSTTLANFKIYTVNGVSFKMIEVEGGTFTMGSPDSDSDAWNQEKPAHQVTLSSYSIGETEVTQALWQAVMGSNPSYFTGDLQRPVDYVSWNDCQEFISKLNELTGENFRLPTEAEWEYAARGGNSSKGYKYSGSNTIDDVAWYTDNSSSTTHAVKIKQPNELGIYDMSGNVREWCSDWYGDYSSSAQTDPTGPTSPSYLSGRVSRGGDWGSGARYCRVACRGGNLPGARYSIFGLRLAISSTEQDDDSMQEPYTVNGVSFTMIDVEGGTFTMGSPDSDSDADSDEKPTHQVTLSNYSIGETEVTQALWQAVMGSNPSYYTGDLQRPVERVSWDDCQTFISKLNELTGENFRLPTEAEWEYAARGGNKSKGYKYSGSNTLGDVAWYYDNSSNTTHAVKTKQPNELGIYDMNGNVWEWCSDWYGSYSSSWQFDPTGPSSGSYRVLRGGGWGDFARFCRVAYRGSNSPDCWFNCYGFRLSLQFIP